MNASAEQQLAWFQDDHFSVSYITPIKKSASLNPTAKKTYRPIAVSHTLSGLYERLLKIAEFTANPPKNFYGYIRGRSTATAVRTLKNVVAAGRSKCGKYLIMLDASGAFESVLWDKVFPKMAESINPRVIQAIWMTYRFNRYEIRWNGKNSSSYFYARQGTKQGGIVSGEVFCEYMNFLNVRLAQEGGIQFNESLWNSLFYADDVILICQSKAQAQRLLRICQSFEIDGYLSWNSDKTVVLQMTDQRLPEPIVGKSGLYLNGKELDLHEKGKYLGYMLNRKLDDHDMIDRLACRLNSCGHALKLGLPLDLLEKPRLKSLANAYGGVYLLPVLDSYSQKYFQKLTTAHRNFTLKVSQIREKDPGWNPEEGIFRVFTNTELYQYLDTKQVSEMQEEQCENFNLQYQLYLNQIRN